MVAPCRRGKAGLRGVPGRVAGLVSGIQRAFLVDAVAGLLGTIVTVTWVRTGATRHDEAPERRLVHHRLVHTRGA
jgi:hypothetical protein